MLVARESLEDSLRVLVVCSHTSLLRTCHVRSNRGYHVSGRCRRRGGSSGRGRGCLLLPSRLLLSSLRCILFGVARRFDVSRFVTVGALGTSLGTGLGLACGSDPLVWLASAILGNAFSAVICSSPGRSMCSAGVPHVAINAFVPPRRVAVVVLGHLVLFSTKRLSFFIVISLLLERRDAGRHKRGRHK